LSWQNLLNSPADAPPVPPVVVPVVPVPAEGAPPVPDPAVPVPVVPVPTVPLPVVPVPAAPLDDDELCDDWSWDCVWSVDVDAFWSAELELELPSAAVPAGSGRLGTDVGTASWLELLLPQALTPRTATASSASTDVRMALRVAGR
jgi:hypothetical protein